MCEPSAHSTDYRAAANRRISPRRFVIDMSAEDHAMLVRLLTWTSEIGTTTNISQRMQDLHATEVLATEPGTALTERMRHQQFRHLRVLGEYFRPDPELLEHVEAIRAKHGPPITTTEQQLLVRGGRGPGPANPARNPAGLGKARLAQAIRRPR